MEKSNIKLIGLGSVDEIYLWAYESREKIEINALFDIKKERLDRFNERFHYTKLIEPREIVNVCFRGILNFHISTLVIF